LRPGVEDSVGARDVVADMDPVVVEVEPERSRVALAQVEGRRSLRRIGEAD